MWKVKAAVVPVLTEEALEAVTPNCASGSSRSLNNIKDLCLEDIAKILCSKAQGLELEG